MNSGAVHVHGKCILLGEHSVVRGFPALVFPLESKKLHLSWEPSPRTELDAGDYQQAFTAALKRALEILGKNLPQEFSFRLTSDIPVRAGLGSSAALSVATVKFLEQLGLVKGDVFSLALELENIFHGSSSGIDVAATLSHAPIRFTRASAPAPLPLTWQPKLYLFDSGLRSATKACVAQVEKLQRPDLDKKMGEQVAQAEQALRDPAGLPALARALEESAGIFRDWGLVPAEVEEKISWLRAQGAVAVKPTGSGNGGFILSLWEKDPPAELVGLIPVSGDSSRAP